MIENMVGKKYGRLTVVRQYFEFTNEKNGNLKRDFCDCVCDCEEGKEKNHVLGKNIRRGMTTSCGCYKYEKVYESCHKLNNYYQIDDFTIIGTDSKGKEFLFSPNQYNKVKDYCWNVDANGYAQTKEKNNKVIFIHNLIMGCSGNDRRIDHINRKRNDNRNENLRFSTIQQNNVNKGIASNNTSGIIGVSQVNENRWHFYIINPKTKKRISGYAKNLFNAIIGRLNLEKEYYKEFAPQRHLFEKYGIKDE